MEVGDGGFLMRPPVAGRCLWSGVVFDVVDGCLGGRHGGWWWFEEKKGECMRFGRWQGATLDSLWTGLGLGPSAFGACVLFPTTFFEHFFLSLPSLCNRSPANARSDDPALRPMQSRVHFAQFGDPVLVRNLGLSWGLDERIHSAQHWHCPGTGAERGSACY